MGGYDRMKKTILIAAAVTLLAVPALAQQSPTGQTSGGPARQGIPGQTGGGVPGTQPNLTPSQSEAAAKPATNRKSTRRAHRRSHR
jgi:hypothetical protein